MNGKSRKVNTVDIYLADPLNITEIGNIPSNKWGRKETLLVTEDSLPDLKWQKLKTKDINIVCTLVQPADFSESSVLVNYHSEKFIMYMTLISYQIRLYQSFTLKIRQIGRLINSWIQKKKTIIQLGIGTVILVWEWS